MKTRLIGLLIIAIALPIAATLGSAYLTPRCNSLAPDQRYDVAVVLSAGLRNEEIDSQPGEISAARTESGIALYQAGIAERLLLTGDASYNPDVAVARGMRDLALARGVPAEAITIEDRSHSTLQNALFSKPLLRDGDRILLVSSGYHLWRGALSMAWAGIPVQGMCKSSAFNDLSPAVTAVVIGRELPKWWINLGRAAIWSVASGLGLRDHLPDGFLN